MLNSTVVSSVYPLASQVTRAGKSLSVVEGSALADVLDAAVPLADLADGVEVEVTDPATYVMESSVEGGDAHDEALNRAKDSGSRAVAFVMDVARNRVVPLTKSVVEAAEASIDRFRQTKAQPMLVETEWLPNLLQSTEVADLIAPYKDAQVSNVAPLVLGAVWGDSAGVGPLHVGLPEVDAQIAEHFSGKEAQAKDTWERFFGAVPGKYREADFQAATPDVDSQLVALLGANALLESTEVPEGLQVDLGDYRSYLARVREQAGARLGFTANRMTNARKAKQLVIDAPKPSRPGAPVSGTIRVAGEVYNDWLAEGGSPEALFGAVAEGASLHYGNLLSEAPGHVKAWQRRLALLDTQLKFEMQSLVLQGLRVAFIEAAAGLPDDQLVIPRASVEVAIAEYLAMVPPKALENLYQVARTGVCRLFFPHTDAETFLTAMDSASEAHPGMDIREVALLVMIDYVTGWIADMVVVEAAEAVEPIAAVA